MSLEVFKDIYYTVAGTINGVVSNGAHIITATSTPTAYKHDINTLQMVASGGLTGTPAGIALLGASLASAVVVNSGSSRVDFIDIGTMGVTGVTTGAATVSSTSTYSQNVASFPASGFALATRSTNGTLTAINGNTRQVSSLTVSGLSGTQASCVVPRLDSTTFFVGTKNGKIVETNTSGATVQTITLPTTPNVGSAPTTIVSGLSYFNNRLLIQTDSGPQYLYNLNTSSYDMVTMGSDAFGTSNYGPLCQSASGFTLLGRGQTNTGVNACMEVFFDSPQITTVLRYNETSGRTVGTWIDSTLNRGVTVSNDAGNGALPLRTMEAGPYNKVSVETRVQDSGTDIAARILRIRDDGIGRTCVELDQNISAFQTFLPATDGHNYIEIAITSGPEKMDAREFQA